MSKWSIIPAALVVFALNTTANADWFGPLGQFSRPVSYGNPVLTSAGGETIVMHGGKGISTYAAPQGYPFYSSCCQSRRPCCANLWSGFCGQARCMQPRLKGGCHRGCGISRWGGCGTSSCSTCSGGKGAVQSGKGAVQGGKGIVSSCGSSCGSPCGSGCGFGGFRLGLFDWLHSGFGCNSCGTAVMHSGCGCSGTISHGKGGHGKGGAVYYHGKGPAVTAPAIESPTPAPPTPAPISTQSAGKWWSPQRFLPLK